MFRSRRACLYDLSESSNFEDDAKQVIPLLTIMNTVDSKETVAIVVPIYRSNMTSDEEISFQRLFRFLRGYEIYGVVPQRLDVRHAGLGIRKFDDKFFSNTASYSRLLLSREFYEAFSDYEYVLIYQLDCLVFSDRLTQWCDKGFDYIGAPWFKSRTDPEKGFSRVGNGGFSLRKVQSFLKVIDSTRYLEEPVSYWEDLCLRRFSDIQDLAMPQKVIKKLRILRDLRRGVRWYMSEYTLNEDRFWSDRATLFCPDFKIAPIDVGLEFSFERFPKYCFEQNKHTLPFGCHAWTKYDQTFWESHLFR